MAYGAIDFHDEVIDAYRDDCMEQGMQCCLRNLPRELMPWDSRGVSYGTQPFGDPPIRLRKSQTYVYEDPRHNFIVKSNFIDLVLQRKIPKAEIHRLGNENSEDALTANVLLSLRDAQALGELWEQITGAKPNAEPQLFLWGLSVCEHPGVWPELTRAREYFEQDLIDNGFQTTEPDAVLSVPDEGLILIEAKFSSSNTSLEHKSREKFLKRYNKKKVFNSRGVKQAAVDETPEQLLRNIAFADFMASPNQKPFVVNLIRESATRDDAESKIAKRLAKNCRVKYSQLTWESVYRDVVVDHPTLFSLATYMRNKTFQLRRAFKLS